ncbi:hypothetical protein HPO96_28280 [Kribbella sandramycini]|uniref:Uncharacterized protein n=1 Tax=Kribbella sandramycini TaxID=60450 RepID=A0A7Y4P1V9_9ACTN|nr:hypothetical protein [Kribbella sandramycini]MBB6571502.1 hypothetical protein [Kribbella sandramycini]NOL44151.1 hypothetical protein [Kribbella sandramycini]
MTAALANYLARRHRLVGEPLNPPWELEMDWGPRQRVVKRARELAACRGNASTLSGV